MIISHCGILITGNHEDLQGFLRTSGLPETPFSFATLVPVGALEDEALLEAWGSSGLPEPIGPRPFIAEHGFIRLRFKCPGGPPLIWLAKVSQMYPKLVLQLMHATEATAVHGEICHREGITRTTEIEGDPRGTDEEVDYLLR